jgi:hypothetical protein
MAPFIWVLIPLAGIAYAAFAEWLKFKRKTDASANEVQQMLSGLSEEIAHLTRRVENVEAIVTTEEWDRLQSVPRPALELPEEDTSSDEEAAARLARRLRG